MKVLCIIPARLHSTRFPEKVLALIEGKAMLHWVYERAASSSRISKVLIATDHPKIADYCISNSITYKMSKFQHHSGTSRCLEACQGEDFDILINLQADEPFLQDDHIESIYNTLDGSTNNIATLAIPSSNASEYSDPNIVKVAMDIHQKALYFSRSPLPYYRNPLSPKKHFQHIGIYAFRKKITQQIAQLNESKLESAEKLEQLSWLEEGFSISVGIVKSRSMSIDTPEELQRAIESRKL